MQRCPVCQGVISALGDCIECGLCILCYPYDCQCEWSEFEDEEDEEDEEGSGSNTLVFSNISSELSSSEIVSRETIGRENDDK